MTWTSAPLKHVAAINARALSEDTDPGREFRYIDISSVGRGSLVDEPVLMRFEDAPSRARRLVREGDTIVSTVRTYLRVVWPVRGPTDDLVCSTGFAVLSPRTIEPRYFSWWLQSDEFIEEVVARSVGVSYPAINASDLGAFRVPMPPAGTQRAIADYLDTETARLDTLVAKKLEMLALLRSRWRGRVARLIDELVGSRGEIPLKWMAEAVTVGIVITPARWYAGAGVPALRGVNITERGVQLDDLVFLSQEGHRLHKKSELRRGDVVVVRTGQAGAAAVVPEELDGSNCIDLLLVRPGRADPRFLCFVLNSEWAQHRIEVGTVGTIQSHYNVAALRSLSIPHADEITQREVADELEREARERERLRERLQQQIDLLNEHRQALITVAVTGQIDVPGVPAS